MFCAKFSQIKTSLINQCITLKWSIDIHFNTNTKTDKNSVNKLIYVPDT